ncbi:AmiS/UreI family transporter [Streptosporangium carneum]|uniref:Transporter n=1 Tax=Streptosporangium carneum TaxID=47481 RepID=A0A9W6MIE6_9ACTN|nr:AmiS/UreI family transporter [Streptosporangium carneum]GLK14908.1 transporter [Streptosporangium carneum]
MGVVGLLYVGAVLFINGMMLLGKIDPRAAGIFNLFVGALQVITPTVLIILGGNDPLTILGASGIFLFGFTYLYVGIGLLGGFDTTGVGYFSLFVAIMALGFSFANFRLLNDKPFGVIWLYWSFLWLLFFLLLGLKHGHLTAYTGWVTAIEGWVTAAIPSFFLLTGYWQRWNQNLLATLLAVFGVVVFGGLWVLMRKRGELPSRAGPRGGETIAAH